MANKTVTVKASGGDYSSLNAALAGESANLITNTCILTIECYAMTDTTVCNTGTGYTVNSSYYINITVPTAARHSGVWDASKYNLSVSAGWSNELTIAAAYTRINGIQCANTNGYGYGALFTAGSIIVANSIGKGSTAGDSAGYSSTFFLNLTGNIIFVNCISNGSAFATGFFIYSGTPYFYNCVSINNAGDGFKSGYNTATYKNCYAGGNTGKDYNGESGYFSMTTCHAEDATGNTQTAFSPSSGARFTNVTPGSEDLHIGASSSLIGAATNLYNDATYPFQTDIIGTDRGGAAASWDVGVFEYIAAGGGLSLAAAMHHYKMMRG